MQEQNTEETLLSKDIDCDSPNSNLTNNSESLISTASFDAKSTITQKQQCDQDDFNSDADFFNSEDFICASSVSSDNLELDKIVEQLENNLENDPFVTDSVRENMSDRISESNLSNGDINLGLDEVINNENDDGNTCSLGAFSPITSNKMSKEDQIIDMINEELHNTLQFTDVLCHYIYSDVIVGKDFFQLFCNSDNVGNKLILGDVIEDVSK